MSSPPRRSGPTRGAITAAVMAALALVAGGCDIGGGPPAASSAVATLAPQPSPRADAYWLRATATQAIPPIDQFPIPPVVTITGDGTYITVGPQDAMYPGPALPNLLGRPIDDAGRAAILAEAQRLGLLSGQTDWTADPGVPGGVTGRLELTVDGRRITLTGSPESTIECVTTPCEAPPGTPAAFAAFWAALQDPASWLGDRVGAEEPYVAESYALLVGPPPPPEASIPTPVIDWPLDASPGTFGRPVANDTRRCGSVTGSDATTLRPSLEQATQASPWSQDPTTSATLGIVARPFVPGEDPCAEWFGPG
jgi:hypothetical protein